MTEPALSFGSRLDAVFGRFGRLCAGIDPHPHLLEEWGLPVSASGAREFGLRVVDAAAQSIGIVKPQLAFYERYGSAGFAAAEEVLCAARSAELLVIADVKRGDIGSTMDAYAEAWLTPGSPLEVDAITVTAYTGIGALGATFDLARAGGKGVFVLCATSNTEGASVQRALVGSSTLAASIADEVSALNHAGAPIGQRLGDIGLVVGATHDPRDYAIDLDALAPPQGTPILAPGFGQQGARYADIPRLFGSAASCVIAAVSRSVLAGGQDCLAARMSTEADALGEVAR